MNTQSPLVAHYVKELDRAAAVLPPARRRELLAQIHDHIEGALASPGADHSEAGVRSVLDRLGTPEEIVREAFEELPAPPATVSTIRELIAALLMTLGSVLLPVIGWLIGILLFWGSPRLRTRHKVLGTLVVPGGAGGLLLLALTSVSSCFTSTSSSSSGATVTQSTCGDPNVWLQRFETGAAVLLLGLPCWCRSTCSTSPAGMPPPSAACESASADPCPAAPHPDSPDPSGPRRPTP